MNQISVVVNAIFVNPWYVPLAKTPRLALTKALSSTRITYTSLATANNPPIQWILFMMHFPLSLNHCSKDVVEQCPQNTGWRWKGDLDCKRSCHSERKWVFFDILIEHREGLDSWADRQLARHQCLPCGTCNECDERKKVFLASWEDGNACKAYCSSCWHMFYRHSPCTRDGLWALMACRR